MLRSVLSSPQDDLSSDNIRSLRQRLGLTQAELATRLGCSTQAVSFWERGTRTPTGLYADAMRRLLAETTADGQSEGSDPLSLTPTPVVE